VKVAGLTFKCPVLSAASELVFDGKSAEKVATSGVGGIVTKTFTSSPEFRIRLRPYQFPLTRFDPALKKSGSLYSLASPHVEDIDVVMRKNVPEIAPYSVPPETPYRPKIDRKRCNLCGTCARTCFYQVFHFDRKKKIMSTEKDRCWSCGFCVGICPEGAIVLVDKHTNRTVWNGKGLATPFLIPMEG